MRPRPSITALTLVAIVLLAGCAGLVDPGDGAGTPIATSTPTAPADANASNTVTYEELGEEATAAFEAARTGGARFIKDTEYVDGDPFDPDAFDEYAAHQYVERNGTYYEVIPSMGELYATYYIRTTPANASLANATAVSDLPETVRDEVRWAVKNGSHSTTLGKWSSLPAPIADTEYVHVDGDVYQLTVAVGDSWVQRIALQKVG